MNRQFLCRRQPFFGGSGYLLKFCLFLIYMYNRIDWMFPFFLYLSARGPRRNFGSTWWRCQGLQIWFVPAHRIWWILQQLRWTENMTTALNAPSTQQVVHRGRCSTQLNWNGSTQCIHCQHAIGFATMQPWLQLQLRLAPVLGTSSQGRAYSTKHLGLSGPSSSNV